MITLNNVCKSYGEKAILRGIDLEIARGSIYGIIGLSGAGKTTLLRTLHLLEPIDQGEIIVDGEAIQGYDKQRGRTYQQGVGMIFQHFNLLKSKNVYQNVALPLQLQGMKREEYDERVREVLAFVGLQEHELKYPDELSGGQKQRVGIARAIVHRPQILLCDEATSALDPQTSVTILALLKKINEVYGITIVLITHQMEVIRSICTEVAVIDAGVIVEQGTVFSLFTNPQTAIAKEFVETVLQRTFPDQVARQISASEHPCYRLTFAAGHTDEPLLSQLTQQHHVHFSILFGTLTEIQEQFWGQLTVEFFGEAAAITAVLHELTRLDITVEKMM